MRIDSSVNFDRAYFDVTANPSSAFQSNDKSGVSRDERQQLLAGKAQTPKEEKVTNTYSERAQLLSSNSRTERSWIA